MRQSPPPHQTCLYALEYDHDRPRLFVFLYLIYRGLRYKQLLQNGETGKPASKLVLTTMPLC